MIHREPRPDRYTNIQNSVIEDLSLEWQDLGLLVYLLSKPDHWKVQVGHLTKQRRAGRDAIYASLKRLRAAGYASFERHADGTTSWKIREKPHTDNPDTGKPDLGNPHVLVNTENSVNTETPVNTDGRSVGPDGKPSSQEALFPETEPPPPADPPKERVSELSPQERANIWTMGKELLMRQDPKLTSNRAGGLLGKLAKVNEKKLVEAIGYCTIHPKADVRSYLFAAVKGSGKIVNIEQAKKAAIAENVPMRRGDTFEHLRDRIYEYRQRKLDEETEEQAETTS